MPDEGTTMPDDDRPPTLFDLADLLDQSADIVAQMPLPVSVSASPLTTHNRERALVVLRRRLVTHLRQCANMTRTLAERLPSGFEADLPGRVTSRVGSSAAGESKSKRKKSKSRGGSK